MLNQKKVEILSRKFRKSLAKQFLEVALNKKSVDGLLSTLKMIMKKITFYCFTTRRNTIPFDVVIRIV